MVALVCLPVCLIKDEALGLLDIILEFWSFLCVTTDR